MHVGLLYDRSQGLLGRASRFKEGREVASLPQLGDRKVDSPGTRVPGPFPISVAVVLPVRRPGSRRRSRPGFNLQIHHAPGGKGQHLAHQIRICLLLDQLQKGHLRVGHRHLGLQVRVRMRTLAEDR